MKRLLSIAAVLLFMALFITGCSEMKGSSYRQTVKGFHGDIAMTVTISGGKIADVRIDSHSEQKEYGEKAVNDLPARIVKEQSLGVDATSGATITSRAIIKGVAEALSRAGADPVGFGYKSVEEISKADEVKITGLPWNKEIVISGEELMQLRPIIEVEAVSINASGEENNVKAKGVTLETILKRFGTSQKDYEAVIATASDNYSIEYPKALLQTRDIIIAYEINDEPTSPRTVVPDERAMYWLKFLCLLELKGEMKKIAVDELVLMDTALYQISQVDYKYYDAVEKAVPISLLMQKYIEQKPEFVLVAAVDGLERNEKYDTFIAQYIMTTTEFAPMYIGPALPEGMRVKNMLYAKVGSECLISFSSATKADSGTSLSLKRLFEICGMDGADNYELTAADGYSIKIAAADIEKGRLELGKGTVVYSFDESENKNDIKQLLRISAVK